VVNKFINLGKKIIEDNSGKDVTDIFNSLHSKNTLEKHGKSFLIGTIVNEKPKNSVSLTNINIFGEKVPFRFFNQIIIANLLGIWVINLHTTNKPI
jgi:cytochrome b involved in lipid metabolism